MRFSLMGVAVSAAAALLFKNRVGGMRQLFTGTNVNADYLRPATAGLTEFARELTGEMNINPSMTNGGSGFHSASATNPESSEIINEIAASVKEAGDSPQVDQLANTLINKNL